jgi:hypothetical protein
VVLHEILDDLRANTKELIILKLDFGKAMTKYTGVSLGRCGRKGGLINSGFLGFNKWCNLASFAPTLMERMEDILKLANDLGWATPFPPLLFKYAGGRPC